MLQDQFRHCLVQTQLLGLVCLLVFPVWVQQLLHLLYSRLPLEVQVLVPLRTLQCRRQEGHLPCGRGGGFYFLLLVF